MRMLWIFGLATLLSGCSSYSVRCNKHLRPINLPQRTVSTAPSPVSGPAGSLTTSATAGKP